MLETNLFAIQRWLPKRNYHKIVIITDLTVKKYYGLSLEKTLKKAGYTCLLIAFPPGEASKNEQTKHTIEQRMFQKKCGKDTLIIALGGGVVGDLAGFIAATYLRGIDYIQIPTTVLAMVDSSIGGKTGVNTSYGKNLLGVIYHPLEIIIDFNVLKTLPKDHRINGLIEAIKICLTHDAVRLQNLIAQLPAILCGENNDFILTAAQMKQQITQRDEKEQNERLVLNFGHTVGHALEKLSDYTLLHGFAIGYGILVEAKISHQLGILDADSLQMIKALFANLNIHDTFLQQFKPKDIIKNMLYDKKIRSNKIQIILLQSIGQVYTRHNHYMHPIDHKLIQQAI